MPSFSPRSAPRLDLELRPSRRLAWLLALIHGAAALALWPSGLSPWWKAAGTLLAAAHWAYAYGRAVARRPPGAIVRVTFSGGAWTLTARDGGAQPARLCGDSYVHPQLVILNFRRPGRRGTTVVILPDSAPAADLRRLRVLLTTGAAVPRGGPAGV